MIPRPEPMSPIRIDSSTKRLKIRLRVNPIARSVPISVVRFATAPYMVIMAPRLAPALKRPVNMSPRVRIKDARLPDLDS